MSFNRNLTRLSIRDFFNFFPSKWCCFWRFTTKRLQLLFVVSLFSNPILFLVTKRFPVWIHFLLETSFFRFPFLSFGIDLLLKRCGCCGLILQRLKFFLRRHIYLRTILECCLWHASILFSLRPDLQALAMAD